MTRSPSVARAFADLEPDVTRRLPDGAQYLCTWNKDRAKWQVKLIIQERHDALTDNGTMFYAMDGASITGVATILAGQYEDEEAKRVRARHRAARRRR